MKNNQNIIKNFNILANFYKKSKDVWRERAYKNAIISIKGLQQDITSLDQIKNVKGFGKSIKNKIKEYLETGSIKKVQQITNQQQKQNSKDKIIDKFKKIWGVGNVKANNIYDQGIYTLTELRKNTHLLTKNQIIGLKHYKDLQKKIPRKYITIMEMVIKHLLETEFGKNSFKMKIAGSYRRELPESGDIDCLITSEKFNLKQLVKILEKWGVISNVLSIRDQKFMGIAHCPSGDWFYFRLDIEFVPEEEWGSGLLYFTGSKEFNILMRNRAKSMNLVLSEHGLFKNKKRLPLFTEKEIMNFLGMNYIEPNLR